ncbi:hypothetical protein BN946_scf184499.g10 [Trametes cinnabarina]|uniref:Uncharacterized protein n=1 Tax=Pycnoporus cinnabarinus TaxID=5643 RepID=A0A060S2F4_PYCCI|nr:hypothetical protein BN946_scf184499.g10 [Trametes cinnabarina]
MRLLNTHSGDLVSFHDPSEVKYAILSHVWLEKESTFQDLERFHEEVPDATLEHKELSAKVKNCCKVARRQCYLWVWIDTCCIDKSSSAELSEAIASMYRWYQQADVSFAFLHDLKETVPSLNAELVLERCKWFARGWTLQELIAPAEVVFYDSDWSVVGTKAGLARSVEYVTGVGVDILTHARPLRAVSVAQRMSWASRRKTTRAEDRSYSLLGIFGVNIPIMYGEGSDAFYRLQEAILRDIPDQTIFAWGRRVPFSSVLGSGIPEPPVDVDDHGANCLFAPSPTAFSNARTIEVVPLDELRCCLADMNPKVDVAVPEYGFTSYGLRSRLSIFPIPTDVFTANAKTELSTPFEYLQPGARPPIFVVLCRGTERIWIDFGTCPDCDHRAAPLGLCVWYSDEQGGSLRIPRGHNPHNCHGRPSRRCQVGHGEEFSCGPYKVHLSFLVHPSPIDEYDECAYYDFDIRLAPAKSQPQLRPADPSSSPPFHPSGSDPYSPRPVTHVQTNFPLWEGIPLWVPAGRVPNPSPSPWSEPDSISVTMLAYSGDGRYLASLCHSRPQRDQESIIVWDILHAGVIRTWTSPVASRDGLRGRFAFSPDDTGRVAWQPTPLDGLEIWSVPLDTRLSLLATSDVHVGDFAWSTDARLLAARCEEANGGPASLRVWDAANSTCIAILREAHDTIPASTVACWNDHACLAWGYRGASFCWDYHTGLVRRLGELLHASEDGALSDEGPDILDHDARRSLVILRERNSDDGLVCHLRPGRLQVLPQGRLRCSGGPIQLAALCPRREWVALATEAAPNSLQVVSYSTGQLVSCCGQDGETYESRIQDIRFSHDGELIAGLRVDGKVRVWRSTDGSLFSKIPRDQGEISRFRFSPGGEHTLATEMMDGTIRIWTLEQLASEHAREDPPSPVEVEAPREGMLDEETMLDDKDPQLEPAIVDGLAGVYSSGIYATWRHVASCQGGGTFAIVPFALLALSSRTALATSTASLAHRTHPAQCTLPTLARAFSAMADSTSSTASTTPSPTTPEFLQERLSALLASPHIHFNTPPAFHGIRMGHGPVDLFSTRFANWFSHDAKGVVGGKEVDREGLKEALLALQRKWDGQSASFVPHEGAEKPTTRLLWAQKGSGDPAEIKAAAEIKEEGGAPRISHLTLDGDPSLFSS